MSDTGSRMMEASSSTLDTISNSEIGNHNLYAYPSGNSSSSAYNYPSTAASIASSDAQYQHDLTNSTATLPLSRPLSRTSTTSCLSVTAFKDGIEGKRVHRSGIPAYPYNLISTMIDRRQTKSPAMPNAFSRNSGNGTPNGANGGLDTTSNSDSASEWSNNSRETTKESHDAETMAIPLGPPVSLQEKMKLLEKGQVQEKDRMIGSGGPSIGPVVFQHEQDPDYENDVKMTPIDHQ